MIIVARANRIAYRIDTLVGRYHRIVLALPEKLILIDEQLCLQEENVKL
jgi:hypothetical protein